MPFNPSQPRDKDGQWTAAGAGLGNTRGPAARATLRRAADYDKHMGFSGKDSTLSSVEKSLGSGKFYKVASTASHTRSLLGTSSYKEFMLKPKAPYENELRGRGFAVSRGSKPKRQGGIMDTHGDLVRDAMRAAKRARGGR